MNVTQNVLKILSSILPSSTAYAHCDYPCGIYDPHRAILGALTVIRMDDLIVDLVKSHGNDIAELTHDMGRAVRIKEEHAEIVKHEVSVIWGDYFKIEHKEKFPELDGLVYEIMQLGSKAKQTTDRDNAVKLLDKLNRFTEIFWTTKGKETKRVKAPYKPEEEIIVPIL